jgi:hypothetical protein
MIDRELLLRPFPPGAIKQRPGLGGKTFDYVSGGDVTRRLLDATGNEFTWTITETTLFAGESGKGHWLVRGTLDIPELGCRDGVGTHPAEGADAAKAAETDAFKRAAMRFGIALHLYEEDATPANGTDHAQAEVPMSGYRSTTRISGGAVRGNGNGNGACPDCHAPEGRPHGTRCRLVGARS